MALDLAIDIAQNFTRACTVIDRLMPRCLRSSFDPEDFVAAAIVDLLSHPELIEYRGANSIIFVARRRMIDTWRSPRSRWSPLPDDIIDRRGDDASNQLELEELRQELLGRAEPAEKLIVDLRLQGLTNTEIKELTGIQMRTIQRALKAFAERADYHMLPAPINVLRKHRRIRKGANSDPGQKSPGRKGRTARKA